VGLLGTFQNYSSVAIAGYLDHCLRQAPKVGLLIHYSETHDNDRLAAQGQTWSSCETVYAR